MTCSRHGDCVPCNAEQKKLSAHLAQARDALRRMKADWLAARAKLAMARATLMRFGEHHADCHRRRSSKPENSPECTCGLLDIEEALK